ncbi:unnamed protein product [Dibothriocephalus latus]|uniref:guanylate cyclase n=1 Tax=Dibothriocephalus latus TaxID=60516 RepID=A0A3P7LE74_DIBLA|nr:unnamed protein product [Dibothriocephalus latus]
MEAIQISTPPTEELREDKPNASYGLNVERAITEALSESMPVRPGENEAFSTVLLYKGSIVHLKRIDITEAALKSKNVDHLRALRELQYENINPFIGVYLDTESVYLVYEHCSRGSLQDVLAHPTLTLDKEFRLSLLNDLIKVFIHNLDLLWTAPELLRQPLQHPLGTQKGDVYSFAIIAYELFCHSPPFGDCDLTIPEILQRIRSENPAFRPKIEKEHIAPTVKALIETAWSEIPECRPSFETISKMFNEIENCRFVQTFEASSQRFDHRGRWYRQFPR